MEEMISLREYAKRYKMGVEAVKHLIYTGQVQASMTPGGHYKIKVGGDTVSRTEYEKLYERCIRAETQLENVRNILGGNK